MSMFHKLTKAVEYDITGRKLEALKLYHDGISDLLKVAKAESDSVKKKHFEDKIKEYLARAEQIKNDIQNWTSRGEVKDKICILEGATNYSYDVIFGKYLNENVKEVLIEEPYIKEFYQLCNFVRFCELVVSKCSNLRCIKLVTNRDDRPNSDQSKGFEQLAQSLQKHNVVLIVDLIDNLHDRQILFSNGYVVKIGRGLNYFKPTPSKFSLGAFNYDFRECLQTNVDILYCPENKK